MELEIRTDSSGEGRWAARVQREDQCERSQRKGAITANDSAVRLSTLGEGFFFWCRSVQAVHVNW